MVRIKFYEVLNSQGEFIVESAVTFARTLHTIVTSVPAGSSTSLKEPSTLSSKVSIQNIKRYHLDEVFLRALKKGIPPHLFDQLLINVDKTPRRTLIGGNTILLLSITYAKVFAFIKQIPLYKAIKRYYKPATFVNNQQPILLLFNIINGGAHANTRLRIQEFKVGFPDKSIYQQLNMAQQFWNELVAQANKQKLCTGVGKEGGISPDLLPEQALDLITTTAKMLKLTEDDFVIYIDTAANDFFSNSTYKLYPGQPGLGATQLKDIYIKWAQLYPIKGIEDPFAEQDEHGWHLAKQLIEEGLLITGDDLTSTNPYYIDRYATQNIINNVIIKPNQAGTLLETIKAINQAKQSGIGVTISHRSKETNDPFLSHIIWATLPPRIKVGNIVRGERVAKFNELLRLEKGIFTV